MLEKRTLNTGENACFSYELLQKASLTPGTMSVVTKPNMERRALVTREAQWQDDQAYIRVTSLPCTLQTYCNQDQKLQDVISIMVGDLQRIMKYPAKAFQSHQDVPDEVHEAYILLIKTGYTKNTST